MEKVIYIIDGYYWFKKCYSSYNQTDGFKINSDEKLIIEAEDFLNRIISIHKPESGKLF